VSAHSQPIYFAQIREDAEAERAVVRDARARRIVAIASGGCTALSLLADGVEHVAAVDRNPAQCALVELRRQALVALSRDEHLAFIGETPSTSRLMVYQSALREGLPAEARAYWDARPEAIAAGIHQCGVTERFYRFLGENLRRSVVEEPTWRSLFDVGSLDHQAHLLATRFATEGFRSALRVLLSRTTHLEFYPAAMFAQVSEHHFGDFFWERFQSALRSRSQRDNYFLHQVLFGRYLLDREGGTPFYLSPSGYDEARRNAHKLSVHAQGIEEHLAASEGLDAVFLSNVLDWVDASAQERIAHVAMERLARGAVLLFRHMLADPPLPRAFERDLELDAAWSASLLAAERSLLYRRVAVGRRR
jgi:S-adenosylmethionine:diacylglycerol 3-amino-3-carboxypropyl transferase